MTFRRDGKSRLGASRADVLVIATTVAALVGGAAAAVEALRPHLGAVAGIGSLAGAAFVATLVGWSGRRVSVRRGGEAGRADAGRRLAVRGADGAAIVGGGDRAGATADVASATCAAERAEAVIGAGRGRSGSRGGAACVPRGAARTSDESTCPGLGEWIAAVRHAGAGERNEFVS